MKQIDLDPQHYRWVSDERRSAPWFWLLDVGFIGLSCALGHYGYHFCKWLFGLFV